MSKKKKKVVIVATENNDDNELEIENPGDCIGNFLENDINCELCEIAESCKTLTESQKNAN